MFLFKATSFPADIVESRGWGAQVMVDCVESTIFTPPALTWIVLRSSIHRSNPRLRRITYIGHADYIPRGSRPPHPDHILRVCLGVLRTSPPGVWNNDSQSTRAELSSSGIWSSHTTCSTANKTSYLANHALDLEEHVQA
jgi:hypothetical protein